MRAIHYLRLFAQQIYKLAGLYTVFPDIIYIHKYIRSFAVFGPAGFFLDFIFSDFLCMR